MVRLIDDEIDKLAKLIAQERAPLAMKIDE